MRYCDFRLLVFALLLYGVKLHGPFIIYSVNNIPYKKLLYKWFYRLLLCIILRDMHFINCCHTSDIITDI